LRLLLTRPILVSIILCGDAPISIIFGPTLMRPEKEGVLEGLQKNQIAAELFALLLQNHERVGALLPKGATYRIFKGNCCSINLLRTRQILTNRETLLLHTAPPPLTESDWNVLLTSAKLREVGLLCCLPNERLVLVANRLLPTQFTCPPTHKHSSKKTNKSWHRV
jgi:hypothetical protein